MSDEQRRLAALERTLVRAAAQQAQRGRRRRRRAVVLTALAAPLALAAAGSMASTGLFQSVDRHLSILRDDRVLARAGAADRIADAAGSRPRDPESTRTWTVAGRRVLGFTTPRGSFCVEFVGLAGGCLAKNLLSADHPVEATSDNDVGTFRVYGLAIDGVTAVSVEARGTVVPGVVRRNAFYVEANALGNKLGFSATLIVRMKSGTVHRVAFPVGGYDAHAPRPLPQLPGVKPVPNTAA